MIKSEINVVPIFEEIKDLIVSSRKSIYSIVNIEMLSLYWKIGKIIMGIQYGEKRAKYGDYVLKELSVKLTSEFGRGFSERNLRSMRKFYLLFPNWKTVSSELSWSHYLELIKINNSNKRNFYITFFVHSYIIINNYKEIHYFMKDYQHLETVIK